jgi:anthranilate synthase
MTHDTNFFRTRGGVYVTRSTHEVPIENVTENLLLQLESHRGGLLASSYEYPGRYKRWSIGFINPPIELATRERDFTVTAHNDRGDVLLPFIAERLRLEADLESVTRDGARVTGQVRKPARSFAEEERSKQPSAFSVVRAILNAFYIDQNEHLGLYGAFGYDLVFQFEAIRKQREREDDQRDLLLYLPDELIVIDFHQQVASRVQYDFETQHGSTAGLPRTGDWIDYRGSVKTPDSDSDHVKGEYADQVRHTMDYFRRGDLFEVVLSQNFYQSCDANPSSLFQTLRQINPSPYGFIFNLGGEYLIGASPEMFVRVDGRRIETCPISGTIKRGNDAIEDADRIKQLLNSCKDETELTMCTDVDRNDKSRICEPGSVQVIGRRQIEMYSHLIHTVDHVEGLLRPEFDALDAFLTHTWAVTVTGAPKLAAMQFIEEHEHTARRWYGGAVGYLAFNGSLNTGLTLRTIRLKDSVAEVRVGATLLYDSIPEEEERETLTKAAALFQTLDQAKESNEILLGSRARGEDARPGLGRRVLLVDCEDSFIHTLANYIRQTGAEVKTLRYDFPLDVFDYEEPDLVVFSPGPGRPNDFKLHEKLAACIERHIPVFGVCLGFQAIVEYCGGELGVLDYPQHGKPSQAVVMNSNSRLFKNLPSSFTVGRYHSLYAVVESMPDDLEIAAVSADGVIMAIEHKSIELAGVQFHPESIMSLGGDIGIKIVENVIREYAGVRSEEDGMLPYGEIASAI